MCRTLEIRRRSTRERPGDDAADAEWIDEASGDLAGGEQALEAEGLLVRGDLEDGIGRGVDDRLAARHVLDAEPDDDLGAGGVFASQHAGEARLAHQGLDQIIRKTRFGVGEIAPVESDRHTHQLPVTRRRVLALRGLDREAGRPRPLRRGEENGPRDRGGVRAPQAEPGQLGQPQRTVAQPVAISESFGAGREDVAEGVRSGIAETGGILGAADAEGVEYEQQGTSHGVLSEGGSWFQPSTRSVTTGGAAGRVGPIR